MGQIPLFVYRDERLRVNLDPAAVGVLEEAKWMRRLKLNVPDAFHVLSMADIKQTHDRMKVHCNAANV